ncbi:MAG: ABC transporter permease [Gemmatimonadetes bacterium]|nr:ABC transporter permease [Gemmatimonadota bacterium]
MPPPLYRWLLAHTLPADERRAALEDMDDLYEARRAAWGERRARRWYARLWLTLGLRLRLTPRSRGTRTNETERRTMPMDTMRQDIRFALRRLGRSPTFALVAVLTLALGIGANTAIFSVVRSVLMRPLPYAEPERVVMVWQSWPGWEETWLSEPEVIDIREGVEGFSAMAAYVTGAGNLTGDGEAERVSTAAVTADIFGALGVEMAAGRAFMAEEDVQGADDVVVLSHGLWQRRFAGDPGLIGSTIRLNGRTRTVVGVLQAGVRLPYDYEVDRPAELWVPLALRLDSLRSRGSHYLYGVARLAPGVTVDRANAELTRVADGWVEAGFVHPDRRMNPLAVPVLEHVVGDVRPALMVLLGAVAFVLLIACANVANLLLARSDERRREVAVRTSLGAGRARILTQLLTESVVLAGLGGIVGVGMAWAGLRVLFAMGGAGVPRVDGVGLDGSVLGYTALVAGLTGILFGMVPAFQLAGSEPSAALKEGSRGLTAGAARQRFRRTLVFLEVALSVVLVIGAALMLRSFTELRRIDLGFQTRNLLTARLSLPQMDYPDPQAVADFHARLLERLETLPGVQSVGAVRVLPLTSTIGDWSIDIEGHVEQPGENPHGDWQVVTPGYFETMGMTLLEGRFLEPTDQATGMPVVVLNETMAREYFPDGAIGKRISFGSEPWFTVVGIVKDVRHNGILEEPRTEMYHAHDQFRLGPGFTPNAMTVVLRTDADPLSLVSALRGEVRNLDPNVPVADIRTMEDVAAAALAQPRFTTLLLGIFGAAALLLAAIGIYGVVSWGVSQRTHEIGIRLALGAERTSVVGLVVRNGAGAAIAGIAVGVLASLYLTTLLERLLYGVGRLDTATFVTVPLTLVAVALGASVVPALRAAAVDPIIALRNE